jgi:hypothetical protein
LEEETYLADGLLAYDARAPQQKFFYVSQQPIRLDNERPGIYALDLDMHCHVKQPRYRSPRIHTGPGCCAWVYGLSFACMRGVKLVMYTYKFVELGTPKLLQVMLLLHSVTACVVSWA